jgi:uncharacterized membrane protein
MAAIKQREINERFARLEERVFRIELRLGPENASQEVQRLAAPAPAQLAAPAAIAAATTAALVSLEVGASAEASDALSSRLLQAKQTHAVPPPLPVHATAVPEPIAISYATPTPHAPVPQGALERTIGLKWAGWIGAVVLVAGAVFGVKFIYDQHWFAQVPAIVWLSAIFIAGLALIGAGEVIYRRVHAIPAASVFGAGVATLFLAGYVGQAYYELYSPGTALFLMAAAALVGALVAMRGNLVSIAVLSHIGANLAPLLVGSRSAPLESFLIYLLALEMVALSLASWGHGKKWWTLRGLSLATTALWVIGTGLRPGYEVLVAGFAIAYAVLYQIELTHSAMRRRPGEPATVSGPDGITFSLLVTASMTLVILWATQALAPGLRGAVFLGMAAVFAALGQILSRGAHEAPSAIERISISHRIATAALVAVAIPVAFSGLHTDIAWGVLAIVFAAGGAKTGSRIARWAGIVTWSLGLGHLVISTYLPVELGGHPSGVWFLLFGTAITKEAGLAFVLSLIGQIIAGLSSSRAAGRSNQPAIILSVVATVTWVVAAFISLPPLAATAWIVEYAWLLVAAEALVFQLRFSKQAAALIFLASIKWLIVDTLFDRLSVGWNAGTFHVFFNPMLGIGILLCASIATLYSIRRHVLWPASADQEKSRPGWGAILGVIAVMLTYALSFEIDRAMEQFHVAGALVWPLWQAKQLAWTIAWTLAAAGVFAALRWRDGNALRRSRWTGMLPPILMLLAVKYLTIDTTVWRLLHAPANVTILANLEAATAAIVLASLVMLFVLVPESATLRAAIRIRRVGCLLASLVLLWAGTIEIDRYFAAAGVFNGTARPEQVALSIFWSIFAVACVLLGFRVRAAELRYFGLALFAVTLLKVVLVDMSEVQAGWRILSFMGLGVLLLGTSVLYGKFSPMLLRDTQEEESHVSVG